MIVTFMAFSTDYSKIDELNENLKINEAMDAALANFDKNNPDPALIWRIAKAYYYQSNLPSRQNELNLLHRVQ